MSSIIMMRIGCLLVVLVSASSFATIDCSSAQVESTSSYENQTVAICETNCLTHCSDVSTEDQLESCLTNDDLAGCLFTVGTEHTFDVEHCTNVSDDVNTIVFKINGEDLESLGDGSAVNNAVILIEVADASFSTCSNKQIALGISTTAKSDSSCTFTGSSTVTTNYVVKEKALEISVIDVFEGVLTSGTDLTAFATFSDSTCGSLVIEDMEIYFGMRYQSGYINKSNCWAIDSCSECMSNGCHWCAWDSLVDTVLPDWLPDWDWLEQAKEGEHGQCGLNSGLCTVALGRFDECGVINAIHFTAVISLLGLAIIFWL